MLRAVNREESSVGVLPPLIAELSGNAVSLHPAVFQVAAGEVQHVGPPVRLLFLPFEQQPLEGGQLQEKAVIE